MSVVVPGEHVPAQHVNLKLGPGLTQSSSSPTVISTRAGTLNHSANRSKWWVESNSRRYVPAPQESVIGIVTQKAIGSLVYARISLAHKDMEPELECFDAQTRKSEGFGELKGGFMVRCSLSMCRKLLDPNHFLLPLLGSQIPLEVAVGVNGRVWISSKELKHTIAISRCIEAVDPDGEGMEEKALRTFLGSLDA
ncbi:hypothetical protein BDZ89DRAFT_1057386 [Hymenopellis radicata]|nr:hypothetical protein BDZ89DRAFT_1057386 [Hymenopellis radicata]